MTFASLVRNRSAASTAISCPGNVLAKDALQLSSFVLTKQSVVHEYAYELLSDSPGDEAGRDGAVHSTAERAQYAGTSHLRAYGFDRVMHECARRPCRVALTNPHHEVAQDFETMLRVRHFGVKLNPDNSCRPLDARIR